MKIQLWKRKNPKQDKNNIYLRFRINQNKAKVESLKLWEWVLPKNKIEKEHNNNVFDPNYQMRINNIRWRNTSSNKNYINFL